MICFHLGYFFGPKRVILRVTGAALLWVKMDTSEKKVTGVSEIVDIFGTFFSKFGACSGHAVHTGSQLIANKEGMIG